MSFSAATAIYYYQDTGILVSIRYSLNSLLWSTGDCSDISLWAFKTKMKNSFADYMLLLFWHI